MSEKISLDSSEDLRKTFCPDGEHDEFLDIYHKIYDMCEA